MGQRKIWEKLLPSERLGAGKARGTAARAACLHGAELNVATSPVSAITVAPA